MKCLFLCSVSLAALALISSGAQAGKVKDALEKNYQGNPLFFESGNEPLIKNASEYICKGTYESESGRAAKYHSTLLTLNPHDDLYIEARLQPIFFRTRNEERKLIKEKLVFNGLLSKIVTRGFFLEGQSGRSVSDSSLELRGGREDGTFSGKLNWNRDKKFSIYLNCRPYGKTDSEIDATSDSDSEPASESSSDSDSASDKFEHIRPIEPLCTG